MPNRSRKPTKDINETAFNIMKQITSQPTVGEKNPAAVALGRLGGLKGGKARAKSLSPKKRKEIAKKAALTRWNNKTN